MKTEKKIICKSRIGGNLILSYFNRINNFQRYIYIYIYINFRNHEIKAHYKNL